MFRVVQNRSAHDTDLFMNVAFAINGCSTSMMPTLWPVSWSPGLPLSCRRYRRPRQYHERYPNMRLTVDDCSISDFGSQVGVDFDAA